MCEPMKPAAPVTATVPPVGMGAIRAERTRKVDRTRKTERAGSSVCKTEHTVSGAEDVFRRESRRLSEQDLVSLVLLREAGSGAAAWARRRSEAGRRENKGLARWA